MRSLAKWTFEVVSENCMNYKDSSQSTVQSHDTRLSIIQIFVREVVQNIKDAINRTLYSCANLEFELQTISGSAKTTFLKTMKFSELVPHLNAVRTQQVKKKSSNIIIDPNDIIDPGTSLRLLYINDHNTLGLLGPEFGSERPESINSFLGLCRGTGFHDKPDIYSSGGTNGYGKSVLWKHSSINTVFLYSSLSTPYIDPEGNEHKARLIGISRLPDHYLDNQPTSGITNFGIGINESKNVRCLYDNEADTLAHRLGFKPRAANEHGTSILIVGFQDLSGDEKTDLELLEEFKRATEEYYWPSIIKDELAVNFFWRDGDHRFDANPTSNIRVKPFIDALQQDNGIICKSIFVNVPKNPTYDFDHDSNECEIKLSALIYEDTDPASVDLLNHVALIRGSHMVIKYEKINGLVSGKSFHGVIEAGTAVDDSPKQKHLEKLLALSEPISHDDWNKNSDNLKDWYGSKTRISKIKELIRNEFISITSQISQPEGDAAPALRKLFSFGKGEILDPRLREIRQRNLTLIRKRVNNGLDTYQFSVEITVPGKDQFLSPQKPSKWKLQIKCGAVGERGTTILLPFSNHLIEARKNGHAVDFNGEQQSISMYEDDVSDQQTVYRFVGQTAGISPEQADLSKVELQVETFKL
jgi:hypothetical protein